VTFRENGSYECNFGFKDGAESGETSRSMKLEKNAVQDEKVWPLI